MLFLQRLTGQPELPDVEQPDPPKIDSLQDAVSLITGKLDGWMDAVVLKLPNLLVAVLILLLFWLLARLVRSGVRRTLTRTSIAVPIRHLLTTAAGFAILVTGLFIALEALGLDKTVTSLLAGVGILGLALGFAFQNIAANFIAGILISVRQPFSVGQIIRTNEFFGTVQEINLRATVLQTPEGQIVRIPNQEVLNKPMVNYSTLGRRRIDLGVGVSYGDDLDRAKELAVEAVESIEGRLEERPVELFYEEFGSSSINFAVRFWIPFGRQPEYLDARSEAIQRIKRAFDDNGITIPFPIRTLDFGIVGGEKLSEALSPELFHQAG